MPHEFGGVDIYADESFSDDELAREVMNLENMEREADEARDNRKREKSTPKLECLACGQVDNEHDADCSAMKDLEQWALHSAAIRTKIDRQTAMRGEKQPMSGIMPCGEDEEEFSDPDSDMDQDDLEHMVLPPPVMDLRWFFNLYEVDVPSQIAVCRTHANNLAAVNRAVQPKEKERKTKKSKTSKK